MKIGNFDNPSLPSSGASSTTQGTKASQREAVGRRPGADASVALSNVAASLTQSSSADFDAPKVARMTQALRDGTFAVNADAIADKLIQETAEWMGAPQTPATGRRS